MPRPVWRPLRQPGEPKPAGLPVMVQQTGRVRVERGPPLPVVMAQLEGPANAVQNHPPEDNQFPHPPQRVAPEAVATEAVEEHLSVLDELKAAEKKVKEAGESSDGTSQKVIDKMGSGVKYLKKALALSERFQ